MFFDPASASNIKNSTSIEFFKPLALLEAYIFYRVLEAVSSLYRGYSIFEVRLYRGRFSGKRPRLLALGPFPLKQPKDPPKPACRPRIGVLRGPNSRPNRYLIS